MNGQAAPRWQAHCEALYRQHAARLVRLGRLVLGDKQEAEEVAQEVFLKLIRTYEGPVVPIDWAAWLTRVTINACRDRRRAGWWAWSRRHRAPEMLELVDGGASPEQAAAGAEFGVLIAAAFQRLSARQREVFALRYIEGMSTHEVAGTLDLSEGSVKRHLFRAVKYLRGALGEIKGDRGHQ